MSPVLCATRGGEASITTQKAAIALAKERDKPLVFLYVADISFLNKTAAAVVIDVEEDVLQMGDFLLTMAVERAMEEGVKAEAIVKSGVLHEVLPEVANEHKATIIVLGRPAGETSRFGVEETAFDNFLEAISKKTGAEIVTPVESSEDSV